MTHQYSENLNEALQYASRNAQRASCDTYGPAHILKALLVEGTGIIPFLESMGKEVDYIKEWASMRCESYPKSMHSNDYVEPDTEAKRVLNDAIRNKLVLGTDFIDPFCVFLTLITPGSAYSNAQLRSIGITPQEFMRYFESDSSSNTLNKQELIQDSMGNKLKIPYCKEYQLSTSLLTHHEIIGRDKEVRLMQEALLRYFNIGILITGDSGVGKSSLIHAFLSLIVERKEKFKVWENVRVLDCDIIKLMNGTQGLPDILSRLQKVIDATANIEDRVLLILDDLHLLLSDQQSHNNGLLSMLGAKLKTGEISIIATTSTDNFRKVFEKHSSLLGRMERIQLEELNKMDSLKCLEQYSKKFLSHYEVSINEEALKESIELSQRYFKEKKLPFSAIELMDKTLSAVKICNEQSKHEVSSISKKIEALRNKKDSVKEEELILELKWLDTVIQKSVSPILLGQIADDRDAKELEDSEFLFSYLEQIIGELWELTNEKIEEVTPIEIASIVAHITNIPIGKVRAQEKDKLLNIDSYLKRRVVGQDQAIQSISEAIVESRSGLNPTGQPIGSFFFLGPTGTGKTELAKTLAEFLFDDEKAMIRFDMSEFKEEHSAALLYGAPPGYVGYQEGGLLVSKIRQQPYSVVLFDEIEKAHSSVYDVFLQIMDEGHIHDKLGREGDFSNAIIIFTSNIGSEWVTEQFRARKVPESKALIELMSSYFRPEFLGRLTEVVPFGPISKDVVELIFNIQLNKLRKVLGRRKITLELSKNVSKKLGELGYSEKYGARPVVSVIRSEIRRPISRKLVSGELDSGMVIQLDYEEKNGLSWTIKNNVSEKTIQ